MKVQEVVLNSLTEDEKRLVKSLRDFMNQPFRTFDFDNAHTRSKNKFHIVSMEDFSKRSYPEKVNGYVEFSSNGIVKVWWDRHGKCHLAATGKEKREYDLIRKENKKMQSGKIIAGAFMFIIAVLVITAIFKF